MGPPASVAAANHPAATDEYHDEVEEEELGDEEEEEEEALEPHDDDDQADAAAAANHQRHHDSKNKKNKKKNGEIKLMESSGLTEAERRELRHAQRKLHDEIMELSTTTNNNKENNATATTAMNKKKDHTHHHHSTTTTTLVQDIRQKNNALFHKVAFTREAVLDGENLDLLTKKAMEQVDRLIQVPRFDAMRLTRALTTKCCLLQRGQNNNSNSTRMIDWKTLGWEAGICFNAIPSHVAFLHGPLQADYVPKPTRQMQKRTKVVDDDDDDEEEEVEDVKMGKHNAGQGKLSQVEYNIDLLKKVLKKRCDEQMQATMNMIHQNYHAQFKDDDPQVAKWITRHGQEVCAIQFLFNPQSFTQTVENLFYFSFLVKSGAAEIVVREDENEGDDDDKDEDDVDDDDDDDDKGGSAKKTMIKKKRHPIAMALASMRPPGPVIRVLHAKGHPGSTNKTAAAGDDNHVAPPTPQSATRQAICNLTMESWRELCQAYNVTKGDLPHRSNHNNDDTINHNSHNGRTPTSKAAAASRHPIKKSNSTSKRRQVDEDASDENDKVEHATNTATARRGHQTKKQKVAVANKKRVHIEDDDDDDDDEDDSDN